jgi:hypothetical protein
MNNHGNTVEHGTIAEDFYLLTHSMTVLPVLRWFS